ncbi:RsbRD N-terminal domain-containing protein [Desulforhopalus sp. 52FAK]
MDLAEGFRNHRDKIVNKWVEYTLDTYNSSGFFIKEKDKFANPVGGNVREALGHMFTLLAKGADSKEHQPYLDQIISIRSVQEFTPAQAVAPLNAVKHITREVFLKDKERAHLVAELYDFEFAVDLLVLASFDTYMQYRERIYKVRLAEIKSGSHILTDSKCPSNMLAEADIKDLTKETNGN